MEILCKNNQKTADFAPGTSFSEMFTKFDVTLKGSPICVCANGLIKDMGACAYSETDVEFLDETTSVGARIYQLGLVFVLSKAVAELYPGGRVLVSKQCCHVRL